MVRDAEVGEFIAIRFSAPGIKSAVGVWATNRLDGTGLTMSVDSVAQAFSEMADADKTKADISRIDPSVAVATGCL